MIQLYKKNNYYILYIIMCDSDKWVQNNTGIKDKVKHFEDNILFNPDNKDKTVYLLFKADWCCACKNFKPEFLKYRELCKANRKDDMIMVIVDVDSGEELSKEYKIQGLPTTYVYRIDNELLNNKENKLELYKEKIVGSDKEKLASVMKQYNNL
jgi:thiol-disulfide isomerase/thioredoxin